MMELINAPGWARNVYPVTYLSGSTQDCADLHSFGPGMREIYILHYVLRGRSCAGRRSPGCCRSGR